jgi:hypothetical protein
MLLSPPPPFHINKISELAKFTLETQKQNPKISQPFCQENEI